MMRFCCSLVLAAVSPVALAATLSIAAGDTYTVSAAAEQLELDVLEVGDGATIRLDEGLSAWRLSVQRARIGDNVVIDARGREGRQGGDGLSWSEAAADCAAGDAGGDGLPGGSGANGARLQLRLGIASLGSLRVLASGGDGGDGGRGGRGQDGGGIDRCRGGDGGAGGNGGAGGSGGNAGAVSLAYWPVDGSVSAADIAARIAVSSRGGEPGRGGAGGAGGEVVPGQYQQGSVMGKKRWLSAGKPGTAGVAGVAGEAGREAQVSIVESLERRLGQLAAQVERRSGQKAAAGSGDSRDLVIQELQRRLELLERRVRTLETQ